MLSNILIVDLNHLLYRYGQRYFSGMSQIEQSLASIKNLIETIKKECNANYTVIVGDLSCPLKTEFYNEVYNIRKNEDSYKSGRNKEPKFNTLLEETIKILSSKYPVIRASDYEADDIITSIVQKLDNRFNKYILTIDADMLPLIDDTTSVYLFRNKIDTRFENIEKYYLFNKQNFEKRIKMLNSFTAPGITLNNILLVKMLIGDKSDNIPRVEQFTSANIKDFIKWSNLDKKYKWSYFSDDNEVEKYIKSFLLNPESQKQALNNFKIMKMNSDLGGRRKPFEIEKKHILISGDHSIIKED